MYPSSPSQTPHAGSLAAIWIGALRAFSIGFGLVHWVATAASMPSSPIGALETGAPAFVVLGPEALGLGSSPVDIQSLPDGRILVVSQEDLAFGDGVRWDTYHAVENEQPILSSVVVDDDGTLFTGIDGGFASIELIGDARWRLKPVLKLGEEIAAQNATLINVTSLADNWYWYGGNGTIVAWRPGRTPRKAGHLSGIDRIFNFENSVYVSDDSSGGLFRLTDNGSLDQVRPDDALVSSGITCATSFSKNRMLVGTGSSGVKLFDGVNMFPFGNSSLLGQGHRITDICSVGNGFFAAAIDSMGIAFFDRDGRMVQVLERTLDHRLARARKLCYSPNGVLWALLNDGVARIQFPSPVTNFDPLIPSGLKYAKPLRHDGLLWVFADGRALRGVYSKNNRLTGFVDETPPGSYLFTLTDIGGILLGANEEGIFSHEPDGWHMVLPGIRNARLGVARTDDDGICYVARGEYGTIRRVGDKLVAERNTLPGLGDSYGCVIDSTGAGWIELGTSLVGRCTWSDGRLSLETFGPSSGLDVNGWIEIYEFEGTARFHVSGHLYRYDEATHTFSEDQDLLRRLPQLALASGRPVEDSTGRLWCTGDDRDRPQVAQQRHRRIPPDQLFPHFLHPRG